MTTVKIELFTRTYTAEAKIDETGVHMDLLPEAKKELEQYLRLVLPSYVVFSDDTKVDELTLDELIQIANEWQEANPDQKLSEPLAKLPYEIPTESKEQLEELASAMGVSMSQLLIEMIDKTYEKVEEK